MLINIGLGALAMIVFILYVSKTEELSKAVNERYWLFEKLTEYMTAEEINKYLDRKRL